MTQFLSPDQRLMVALDVPTITEAHRLVDLLSPVVSTFKIGYWLMFDPGLHPLIRSLKAAGKQVFLDAKLNDIPETVKRGVAAAGFWGVDFITVHSEETSLAAAMTGKGDYPIKVMAVTALSSIPSALSRDKFRAGTANAIITNCDGLIMTPADLYDPMGVLSGDSVRQLVGDMIIATPGVRLTGEPRNDHERSGTPAQAISDGADYVIVGRPIIHAADPLLLAEMFVAQIALGMGQF